MDAGKPGQEGGTDSDAPPGDTRSPQGVGRADDPRPIDHLRSPAGSPHGPVRPIVRPYQLHHAKDAASALSFSNWFQGQRQETLGVAYQDKSLGFANAEEGWQVDLGQDPLVDDACRQALTIFDTNDTPALVFEDAAATIVGFKEILGDRFLKDNTLKAVLRLMHGDLQQLQRCIGRRIPKGQFPSPADEAYSAYTAEQHWGVSAPAFYRAVALPRLAQQIHYAHSDVSGIPWRISYGDLFLRVIAHATREPLLLSSFVDGADPVAELAGRLGLEHAQVIPTLFWTATNFDAVWLSEAHPALYTQLPDDLLALRQSVEKHLAVICLSVIQHREDYTSSRRLQTLYGRLILWGLSLPEALAAKWLGSVQDLLDVAQVACAAFWGDDPLSVGVVQEGLLERTIRVRGFASDDQSKWMPLLEGTAQLNTPLSIPLNPAIIWSE